jgi:hypothetical protein
MIMALIQSPDLTASLPILNILDPNALRELEISESS